MKLSLSLLVAVVTLTGFSGAFAQEPAPVAPVVPTKPAPVAPGGKFNPIDRLKVDLALTDEQVVSIQGVFNAQRDAMANAAQQIRAQGFARIKAILTPEQLVKFEALSKKATEGKSIKPE